MKSIQKLLLLLAVASFGYGCDGAIDSEYVEQISVTGFIYPGEAIDSVILRYTVPFGQSYNDSVFAVVGADVRVRVDGKEYQLLPGTIRGRYYLPASELIVEGGKEYELLVKKDGHDLYARTKVPMPIKYTNLETSLPADRILPLDTTNASGFSYTLTAGPIEPKILYMLQVNALDTTVGKIYTDPQAGPPVDTSAYVRNSFIQTAPRVTIYSRLFGWFGPNRMTMLALDSNWVDYKRQVGYGDNAFSAYQPSLNKVQGGLGIWASAAKDTVTVYIKHQPN
jgi:hypothetical protein